MAQQQDIIGVTANGKVFAKGAGDAVVTASYRWSNAHLADSGSPFAVMHGVVSAYLFKAGTVSDWESSPATRTGGKAV